MEDNLILEGYLLSDLDRLTQQISTDMFPSLKINNGLTYWTNNNLFNHDILNGLICVEIKTDKMSWIFKNITGNVAQLSSCELLKTEYNRSPNVPTDL
jgi:hypothetical protein